MATGLAPPYQIYYKLVGRDVVACDDVDEWAEALRNFMGRRVGYDIIDDVIVSTIFLGLDHQFIGGAEPLFFETCLFDDADSHVVERYTTWEQAEAGHARWLRLVNVIKSKTLSES